MAVALITLRWVMGAHCFNKQNGSRGERLAAHYSWLVVLSDGRVSINVTRFFSLLVPAVLGHAASENEEVDQTKSGGKQSKVY